MIYHVEAEQVTLNKRILRAMFVLATVLLGATLAHYIWYPQSSWEIGENIFEAIVAGYVCFLFESQRKEYDIEVTEETIVVKGGFRFGSRRVRRGRIRYLRELRGNIFREPALRLSEHGAIYRFLVGGVWIPISMPQYEQIKTRAMGWMEIG